MTTLAFSFATGCDSGRAPATEAVSQAESAETPIRVVSLSPFASDQLLALGHAPAAVPLLRDGTPGSWDGLPTVALDHSAGPNIEQLLLAEPDVVITTSTYAQFLPAMQQATGAEIVVMDVDSVADVPGHIQRLAAITGRETEADKLVADIESSLPTGDAHADPVRVLAVFGTPHAFYAFLPTSYLGDLVARAGGLLITEDLRSHRVFRGLAPLSMEAVIDRDPEYLLVVFHGSESSARAMLERDALWGRLSAVRDGRVTFLHDDLYAMRPGSEVPRAITEITQIMQDARAQRP